MLEGNLVCLRALEPGDLGFLLEWRNRPDFRCYFREYRELSLDRQKVWYERTVLNDSSTIMFSIVKKATGELLGACGLCYINWVNRSADFSIYIGAENLYIDKKYAPDAAIVMARYAFGEINMHRVWAEVYDFDERKIALFKSLGFRLEGHFKETYWHDNCWHDSLFFSMLEYDYATYNKKDKNQSNAKNDLS
jgi:RimJ/RimL family protein N-acetyltransferase